MKIVKVLTLASLFIGIAVLPASGRTVDATAGLKADLPLKMLLARPTAGKAMLGKAVTLREGTEQVDVLVKTSDAPATQGAIEAAGGQVRSIVGGILTAFVPVDAVASIASLPEVVTVEASKPLRLLMDTARSAANTNVVAVQDAGFTGRNVVVGVIDSGLDYSRADFASEAGGTRVQYLRFQSATSSGGITVTECAKDKIDAGTCSIPAENDAAVGHGTHVTGIAAGGDTMYKGVAPAADIFLVRNTYSPDGDLSEGGASSGTFSGGVIDGVAEIFKKADILDKPAVINLSQGTHIGAHDNTSLLEEALNDAVAGGYATGGRSYGRAIVAAAGNEHIVDAGLGALAPYAGGIHGTVDVAAGDALAWRLWILDPSEEATTRTPLVLDLWFGDGQKDDCSVAANAYQYADVFSGVLDPAASRATTNADASIADMPLAADASNETASADNAVGFSIATTPAEANGRPRAMILYGPASGTGWEKVYLTAPGTNGYFLDVIVRASGGACTGDLWIEGGGTLAHFMKGIDTGAYDMTAGTHGDAYALAAGDNDRIVTIPATASDVIAVGAYLQTKPAGGCPSASCWRDIEGVLHDATDTTDPVEAANAQINGGTVGARTPFSSIGPAAYAYSGRKPDILAPGDPIISVRPSGFTPMTTALLVDDTHYKSQGTSQASPHAAGIVALLFEKNNRLTAASAATALTSTATKAASPNDQDGYGNVRASGAMAAIATDTTGYAGTGNLKQSDLGGGGDGGSGGGCGGQLVPTQAAALPQALLLLVPLLALAWRRRRS